MSTYKASHHGSETSSSAVFMADLQPSLLVISNASNKTFKHPRQITLLTYAEFIADPGVSGKDGTIQIVVDAVEKLKRLVPTKR
jgi:beta-lactamase superfamily II metal-dependent hydrolase